MLFFFDTLESLVGYFQLSRIIQGSYHGSGRIAEAATYFHPDLLVAIKQYHIL